MIGASSHAGPGYPCARSGQRRPCLDPRCVGDGCVSRAEQFDGGDGLIQVIAEPPGAREGLGDDCAWPDRGEDGMTGCGPSAADRGIGLPRPRSWDHFPVRGEDQSGCAFGAIVAGEAEASVAFADDRVVAFMDLGAVTPGHVLVVPRLHAAGLEDLDEADLWPGAGGPLTVGSGQRRWGAVRCHTLRPPIRQRCNSP